MSQELKNLINRVKKEQPDKVHSTGWQKVKQTIKRFLGGK